jgi:hypothetical protein
MNDDHDLAKSPFYQALQAAGVEAVRQARIHGTNLAIWCDGKVVEITPDEAEATLSTAKTRAPQ